MKKLERAGKWLVDRGLGRVLGETARGRTVELGNVRRILVVRPHNQMGDILLGTPLFSALRQGYPKASITLLASPDNAEIMVAHPDLDELLVFDKKRLQKHPGEARAFLGSLRDPPWDLVIMPTTVSFSVTSAILARIAGGTVRVGSDGSAYGRAIGRRVFDIHVPCRWTTEHQSERNLDFARALDLAASSVVPSMGLTSGERAWARAETGGSAGRRRIGVHPGAGKLPNRWPAERFARVCSGLADDHGSQVYVMVGPKEGALRDAIRSRVDERVLCLPDLPLRRVAALIGELDFLLCNDTGVMHVGAALGTPTLALFGPTDPLLWAPVSEELHWIRARDHRMESLSFDEVYGKIRTILTTLAFSGESGDAPDSTSC